MPEGCVPAQAAPTQRLAAERKASRREGDRHPPRRRCAAGAAARSTGARSVSWGGAPAPASAPSSPASSRGSAHSTSSPEDRRPSRSTPRWPRRSSARRPPRARGSRPVALGRARRPGSDAPPGRPRTDEIVPRKALAGAREGGRRRGRGALVRPGPCPLARRLRGSARLDGRQAGCRRAGSSRAWTPGPRDSPTPRAPRRSGAGSRPTRWPAPAPARSRPR